MSKLKPTTEIVTLAEAGRIIGCTRTNVANLLKTNRVLQKVPGVQGKTVLVTAASLREYLKIVAGRNVRKRRLPPTAAKTPTEQTRVTPRGTRVAAPKQVK